MHADIMVMNYAELIQAKIILNMRNRFCKMRVCFEDVEICVVAKVVFSKSHTYSITYMLLG